MSKGKFHDFFRNKCIESCRRRMETAVLPRKITFSPDPAATTTQVFGIIARLSKDFCEMLRSFVEVDLILREQSVCFIITGRSKRWNAIYLIAIRQPEDPLSAHPQIVTVFIDPHGTDGVLEAATISNSDVGGDLDFAACSRLNLICQSIAMAVAKYGN